MEFLSFTCKPGVAPEVSVVMDHPTLSHSLGKGCTQGPSRVDFVVLRRVHVRVWGQDIEWSVGKGSWQADIIYNSFTLLARQSPESRGF